MSKDSLKKGADYILKGGTLLKDPCHVCNGLLVKFKGNIICINCQESQNNEIDRMKNIPYVFETDKIENQSGLIEHNQNNEYSKKIVRTNYQNILDQIEEAILEELKKIKEIIKTEDDLSKQIDYLKLLRQYLKVLKEIRIR